MLIYAQVLSLVAGVFMLLSVKSKSEKILEFQSIDCIANIAADVLLGGWVGVILCIGGLIRNNIDLIEKKIGEKINLWMVNGIIWILAVIVSCINGFGIVIILGEIVYTFSVFRLDGFKLQIILSLNLMCWLFYDISIKSLPMVAADVIVLIMTLIDTFKQEEDRDIVRIAIKEPTDDKEDVASKDFSDRS